jgi:hypothetical protein
MWVQSSDRRLDDDLLGNVGARVVLHVAVWQRSTRSILAASILAADRAELAGQPKKPERQKQAPLEVDCSNEQRARDLRTDRGTKSATSAPALARA